MTLYQTCDFCYLYNLKIISPTFVIGLQPLVMERTIAKGGTSHANKRRLEVTIVLLYIL